MTSSSLSTSCLSLWGDGTFNIVEDAVDNAGEEATSLKVGCVADISGLAGDVANGAYK
jgi:hypothetical protein